MKKLWLFILPLIALACQQQETYTTSSGVKVTKLIAGEGQTPIKDSIIVIQLKLETDSGKVLTETTPLRPLALAFDPELEAGTLQEVLTTMKQGDSVQFIISAQNLFEETYKRPLPPDMDSTSTITCNMKFEAQMSQENYRAYMQGLQEKQQAQEAIIMEEKIKIEADSIDAFLAEKGITAATSESGLRYVVTEEGSGPAAAPGDQVTVHYAGRIMGGEYFDTSMEAVAKEQGLYNERRPYDEGFTFAIGQGQVIKGWDKGIAYFKEGGKGTLYIPSALGYGSRGSGPKIPPYSILVFDVEVLKIEKPTQ